MVNTLWHLELFFILDLLISIPPIDSESLLSSPCFLSLHPSRTSEISFKLAQLTQVHHIRETGPYRSESKSVNSMACLRKKRECTDHGSFKSRRVSLNAGIQSATGILPFQWSFTVNLQ
ncbi:uncharacterized protein MYCFIDRAFT_175526 [Pseudocercospora fijiensis CIRAD86]|uniref:Secreted protein n=1 Tax=Pseudocercospora fijiensis (strain CIRAD86) TaxID=383855 RepID=M3ABJ1_PSEFD|nr:uncharacterized protein MYCFIDRAFT_175526 [Pseudocercospora fijiensis CIRAD86]EME81951.1 hypothetical protein MYCFIDRAFT_175526 [Pseudocercospora fijiensis CIRAD86]